MIHSQRVHDQTLERLFALAQQAVALLRTALVRFTC